MVEIGSLVDNFSDLANAESLSIIAGMKRFPPISVALGAELKINVNMLPGSIWG